MPSWAIRHVPEGRGGFIATSEADPSLLRRLRYLYGHMPFGLHNNIPRPSLYVTLLRHPVARLKSAYRYIRQNSDATLHGLIGKNDISFRDYVLGIHDDTVDNLQTRFLSGDLDIFGTKGVAGSVDEAMYRAAEINLTGDNVLAGVMEEFDQFVVLLREQGLVRDPYYRTLNRTEPMKETDEVDQELQERILELNRFDLRLHALAKKRVALAYAAVPLFALKVAHFQAENRAWNEACPVRPAAPEAVV